MKIVGKNCVAIFLAAALLTGIFSVISPSFNDAEASGDRNNDKRHDKSKSVIVKKFVCNQNNIDVGGVGIDVRPNDIVSTLAGAQAQDENNQELSANSMGNNERPNGERNGGYKQHDDKKIVFICINNNNGNVPPVIPTKCDDCFITTNNGGFLPPGQKEFLEDFLADEPFEITLEEFCQMIVEGLFTEAEIRGIVEDALPGNQQMLEEELSDCLIEFLDSEPNSNATPLVQTP